MQISPGLRRLGRFIALACFGLTIELSADAANSAAVKGLFANPPREFSSAPLWVWNDLLSEQQIVETLRDLADQQVKQVLVHPRPGLMTPYLSEDWFRLWRVALAEAERLDMNVWIYDENSYPSGFAGGFVPEAMPDARGRGLALRQVKEAPKWTEGTLGIFRLGEKEPEDVTAQARAGGKLPDGHTYVVGSIVRSGNSPWHGGRSYVDLLYPGVTEKFLDITLGAYQRELGAHFGKRIPGIFTDEPNIIPAGELPWTEDLPAQFRQRWGYDLVASLPSLLLETGDWQKIRHDYYATLSQLFIERWAKPYGERCEKLGLEMTGHYWEHEWPNCRGVPDNMAMYAWQQRPAIDCLMNQYAEDTHAQFGNVRSVRELNSIANQMGNARTLCEVYGAGGWDLRFEDMKRQADWLGVLGVNTFDQHLSYVTIRGARKRDHPQSFSYHEPWWKAYRMAGAYLERLSVAVSQGQQLNSILIIEPTTTAWMYQGNGEKLKALGDSFSALLVQLESQQVEYDLGCEDVLARHGSIEGKSLKVGQRAYQTVVLPPLLENLDGPTWDLLSRYIESGGRVLVSKPGATPSGPRRDGAVVTNNAAGTMLNPRWQKVDPADLPGLLVSESDAHGFAVKRQTGDKGILFHMRRRLDDGDLLFLVNTSIGSPSAGTFTTSRAGVEQWDLETGQVKPYSFRSAPGSGVEASFELPPCGSLLLFLAKDARPALSEQSHILRPVRGGGLLEVTRTEPNVLVLDFVDITAGGETRTNVYFYQASQFAFQKNGLDRNPWDSAVQFKDELIRRTFPPASGFKATYRFTIEERVPGGLTFVLERPDLYTVTCNGKPVQAAPGQWWLDKAFGRLDLTSTAQVGSNEVTIAASPFTLYHELEPAYLLGEFHLKSTERGFTIGPDQLLKLGAWNEQGHPFYSAGVRYQQQFDVGPSLKGKYLVSLNSWRGSVAEVRVNGKSAGYIGYAPWECPITTYLRPGENTVAVVAIGTLKNTLGPHHGKPSLGSAWPGMFQRAPVAGLPRGTDYHTVGYGLFEPFSVKQTVEP